MKKLLILLGLAAVAFEAQAALISQYPNATVFTSNDVTIIERPGDTNYSVKLPQFPDAIGAQRTNANLTLWSAIAPSGKQDHSANLDLWSAVVPSAYQLSLGYIPQPATPNLTNWSALATSAKQDHSSDLDLWSAIAPTTKLDTTGNGSGLTSLNASQLASGIVASARLGTGGTGGGTKFLADDQSFINVPASAADSSWPAVSAFVEVVGGIGPHLIDSGTNGPQGGQAFHRGTISGGSPAFSVTNVLITTTNAAILDLASWNVFKLSVLTNFSYQFTNATSLTGKAYVYFQMDTNGGWALNSFANAGGLIQTNANMQPTTNGSALDVLEVLPGFFTTNVVAYWPQDFRPRVGFTNSLGGSGAGTLYTNAVMADSPVGYYRLGEASGSTFFDLSGNSRNLTLAAGSPTYGLTGATTDGDKAITCNSTTRINGQTTPFSPGASDFTLECWLKSTTSGTHVAVGKAVGDLSGDAYFVGFVSGNISFAVNAVTISGSGGNDGNWHHVVGTKTGSGLILYVDGSQVQTGSNPGTCSAGGNFTIGQLGDDTTGGANNFAYPDSVDEVAFYTTALSSGRVAAHFNAR
jgi:hypothetical protein